jgi:ribonuclease PH
MYIRADRKNDEMRIVKAETGFMKNSYGSVLISFGDNPPPFIDKETSGWLTAEYAMLPGSTPTRKARSIYKPDGRNIEIQRLIGRALRAAVDMKKMKGVSIYIDCDVVQADGGTRTASITGGYIALELAVRRMIKEKILTESPLTAKVAAVSGGVIDGNILLDLDYKEDSHADVDFNLIMNDKNRIIEVQGSGEKGDLSGEELSSLVKLCSGGIDSLFKMQEDILKENI